MAHTPGPWMIDRLDSGTIEDIRDQYGDQITGGFPYPTNSTIEANARLIAAAPDLLAALLASPCPRPANAAPDDISVETCITRDECGCNCGAAIAKAKGQREGRG